MADPQPPTVTEGMDEAAPPPASAEDRKTRAAMNKLETRGNDDEAEANQKSSKQTDTEALNKAISRLELAEKMGSKRDVGDKEKEREREEARTEKERRARIKVDQADVGLLVDELDLTRARATDLLKAHEGDAVRAMKAFVTALV